MTNESKSTNTSAQNRVAAIVWAPEELRTAYFARALNAELYNIHFLLYKRPWVAPFKYPLQWLKTWYVLFKTRPLVVFVTNPPIFAALSVAIYCFFFRKAQFIMDTHPPAMYSTRWGWTLPLQRQVAKRAMINITDQERFKKLFESWGAKGIVLRSPRSNEEFVEIAQRTPEDEKFVVTVVNTFAVDEPVEPILEAAKQLPDVHFYVLGNTALADPNLIKSAPENVVFTGYMYKNHYWEQLGKSRIVMVLTTYPHSLVLGGQEAMWVGKPLILSQQPALEEFFTKGTVFVPNTGQGIVEGVQTVQEQETKLQQEMRELADEKAHEWDTSLKVLEQMVADALQKNS